MKHLTSTLLLAGLVLLYCAVPSASAQSCGSTETFKQNGTGSASVFSNATNSKGSLRHESGALLKAALGKLDSAAPSDCQACGDAKGQVVLTSVPHAFLSGYSDEADCKKQFAATQAKPLQYLDRKFASLDELNSWVGDFSQGKGADGADLYVRCPGSCSPQFTYKIVRPAPNSLSASADVVCGPARDKSDNQYDLAVATSWSCSK